MLLGTRHAGLHILCWGRREQEGRAKRRQHELVDAANAGGRRMLAALCRQSRQLQPNHPPARPGPPRRPSWWCACPHCRWRGLRPASERQIREQEATSVRRQLRDWAPLPHSHLRSQPTTGLTLHGVNGLGAAHCVRPSDASKGTAHRRHTCGKQQGAASGQGVSCRRPRAGGQGQGGRAAEGPQRELGGAPVAVEERSSVWVYSLCFSMALVVGLRRAEGG